MANSCQMSEDMVVVQILSRLPPKSLMRFKCVRQLWYNLINSPSFVVKNLSNSMHNKFASSNCILLKRTILKDNNLTDEELFHVLREVNNDKKQTLLSLLSLCEENDDDDHNFNSLVDDLVNVPLPMSEDIFILQIVGHCQGITCLSYFFNQVALCNPSIKEFKSLPESCLVHPDVSYSFVVGFGYDSKAKDYKVLRIGRCISSAVLEHPTRAEVYTLGANSAWREIKADIKCQVYWGASSHLCFKGIQYFVAYTPANKKQVILAFDMGDELFHEISTPDSFCLGNGFLTGLAVWKESIVLLSYEMGIGSPKSFEMWIRDDSSVVKDLWTKHLTIGPLEGIEVPLMVFWNSDELLMVDSDGCVISYNLYTQTLRYLPIHGVEGANFIQAVVYFDSIVSVEQNDQLN